MLKWVGGWGGGIQGKVSSHIGIIIDTRGWDFLSRGPRNTLETPQNT